MKPFQNGWLPSLSGNAVASPRAQAPAVDVFDHLETCSGPCRPDVADQWVIDEELDAEEVAKCMLDAPTLKIDGQGREG